MTTLIITTLIVTVTVCGFMVDRYNKTHKNRLYCGFIE